MLTKWYYPHVGGVETVVKQISEGINKNEFNSEILACFKRFSIQSITKKINGTTFTKVPTLGHLFSTPISPTYIFSAKSRIKSAEIIHLHVPFPLGVLALSNYPLSKSQKLVITIHADPQMTRWKSLFKFYAPFFLKTLNKANNIIVTAPNNKGFPSLANYQEKLSVIPLASSLKSDIPVDNDIEDKLRMKYSLRKKDRLLLFVGRLAQYKGLKYLLKAMKDIEGKVLIVGKGKLIKSLKKYANTLKVQDKVIFTGFVEDKYLSVLYVIADLFVLPSINEGEAFGIVQVEAMSHGLPVINTSLNTGVPFVSQHNKSGLTVPPKDSKAISNAVNKIFFDAVLYQRLSNGARKRSKLFSKRKMIDAYTHIYKRGF